MTLSHFDAIQTESFIIIVDLHKLLRNFFLCVLQIAIGLTWWDSFKRVARSLFLVICALATARSTSCKQKIASTMRAIKAPDKSSFSQGYNFRPSVENMERIGSEFVSSRARVQEPRCDVLSPHIHTQAPHSSAWARSAPRPGSRGRPRL